VYPGFRKPNRWATDVPGKRVQIDEETWAALDFLGKQRMATFQELADEAFADLLKRHGQPATLKEALRRSAGITADVVPLKPPKRRRRKPHAPA
jgi:hypothetical protein